jgi:hypothetical protein
VGSLSRSVRGVSDEERLSMVEFDLKKVAEFLVTLKLHLQSGKPTNFSTLMEETNVALEFLGMAFEDLHAESKPIDWNFMTVSSREIPADKELIEG